MPPNEDEKTKLTVWIENQLYDELGQIAEADDRSISYIVRQALQEYADNCLQQQGENEYA